MGESGAVDAYRSHPSNGESANGVCPRPRGSECNKAADEVRLSGACHAINEGQPLNRSQGRVFRGVVVGFFGDERQECSGYHGEAAVLIMGELENAGDFIHGCACRYGLLLAP